MKTKYIYFIMPLLLIGLSSCSTLRIIGDASVIDTTLAGEDQYCKTYWTFIATEKTYNNVNKCYSGLNAEVIVKPNPIFSFIHVITLGIVKAERVCIKCQAPN